MLLGIVVSILSFGAKCDTTVVNTRAINAAIASCARQGGGVVIVPRGTFVTGTIHMRSHVILRLDSGAVLMGSRHLSDYVPLQYDGDLSRYESGRGTVNYNAATDPQWSLSLIQFVHVTLPASWEAAQSTAGTSSTPLAKSTVAAHTPS